jgi:hypothetical protein
MFVTTMARRERALIVALAIVVAAGLHAQPTDRIGTTTIEANLVQLSTSDEPSLWGGQLRVTAQLHERIDLIESATVLPVAPEPLIQNDFRVRLWGGAAGHWHPAFAIELGYLFQNGDWLTSDSPQGAVHGATVGGTWLFPLAVIRSGSVIAKWAYVFRGGVPDMTIFNCFVQWRVARRFGVRVGGDIHRALRRLKYSGFTVGVTYRL